jgi:hypothetical protein
VNCEGDEDFDYLLKHVGEDGLMCSSDFPHGDPSLQLRKGVVTIRSVSSTDRIDRARTLRNSAPRDDEIAARIFYSACDGESRP